MPSQVPSDLRRGARAPAELMRSKENVCFVTLGEKRRGGRRTGELAAVAYVSRKGGRIAAAERLPPTVSVSTKRRKLTLPTDVVELAGAPELFGARSGHLLQGFDNDLGVCGVAFEKDTRSYVATNAHVVVDLANGGAGDVNLLDRSDQRFKRVGPVVYASAIRRGRLVREDYAVVRADDMQVDHFGILDLDSAVSAFSSVSLAPDAPYWYNVNGVLHTCSHAEWVSSNAPIVADDLLFEYTGFWQLQMTSGAAVPGHSGALLCRTDGPSVLACGIVFGGVRPNLVFAFDVKNSFFKVYDSL